MPKKTRYFLPTALGILLCGTLCAQGIDSKSYGQQIEFRHDNDFFLFTDRYYSSGLFLTYRRKLKTDSTNTNGHQLDFTIGQEVYTPLQTQSTNSEIFDRTYAGFLGLRTGWSVSSAKNELFRTKVLLGITGLNSGAGGLQRWFHRAIGILDSPLWVDELSNSFHFNGYFTYVKEWKIASVPFDINLAFIPNLALGTRDVYLEPETILYFGKRNKPGESIAYSRLGRALNEVYFSLKGSYRNVVHNGLIEGNLFGDNSPVLLRSTDSVWRFGADFNYRFKRSDYKFGVRYNTRETRRSQDHKYIALSYGYKF